MARRPRSTRETPEERASRLAAEEAKRRDLREQLRRKLDSHGAHDLADILRRCAEPLHLTCTCCGEQKTVDSGCKKRWCPVCSRKIATKIVARHRLAFERLQWPLFVTLTVRSTGYAEQSVRDLVHAFFKFRDRKWWKACNIKGGIRGVEITHGAHGWHPHLHLLMDCEWLAVHTKRPHKGCSKNQIRSLCQSAQKELAREWAAHLKEDTAIVWVKRAQQGTEREVVKYTVNPEDLLTMGAEVVDAIRCMRHTRATQAWGSCHGLVKEAESMEAELYADAVCQSAQRGETTPHKPRWMPTTLLLGSAADEYNRRLEAPTKERRRVEADNAAKAKRAKLAEPLKRDAAEGRRYEIAMRRKPMLHAERSETPSSIRL